MEFVHVQLYAFAQSTVRFLIPSAEPDWRLSPHPALPLWSISSHTLGAFLPISSASTVHSRWTACAFAEYLCSGSFLKAGGLRPQSCCLSRGVATPTRLQVGSRAGAPAVGGGVA